MAKLSNSNKSILYQHLIDNECLQYYLTKPRNHVHVFKGYITMFRISAHKLFIEIIDYVHVAVVMILKMSQGRSQGGCHGCMCTPPFQNKKYFLCRIIHFYTNNPKCQYVYLSFYLNDYQIIDKVNTI